MLTRWSKEPHHHVKHRILKFAPRSFAADPFTAFPIYLGRRLATVTRNHARNLLGRESATSRKEIVCCEKPRRRHPGTYRSAATRVRLRCGVADNVRLSAPGTGSPVTTRTHAAVGVRVDLRQDRTCAAADEYRARQANNRRREQRSGTPISRCRCCPASCCLSHNT